MSRTQTADLGAQIAEFADRIDTDAIRERAESGAAELLDAATDRQGRPKRGLVIGLIVAVIAVVVARRALA